MNYLHEHKAQVENFVSTTLDNRVLQERDRDYYDGKQWTEKEINNLKKRKQAPIVVNRVKPKVEGLLGLYIMRKTDPKAYPRTQKHEGASSAITDALRFVTDNNDFDTIKSEVAENFFIEGVGGAIVQVKQNPRGEIEIDIDEIPWDRLYYDPHSRKKDFSDARFMGIVIWMSKDEVMETFGVEEVDMTEVAGDAFDDRPQWVDNKNNRIKVCQHFYIEDGVWKMHMFTENQSLVEPEDSQYLDEFGQPTCPIELVSANVDRDNNRYSEVRTFISQQDEINHRRSKALHLLSQRQTFGRQGAEQTAKLKQELAKPDGHVEFQGDAFGKDFGILPTGDMAQGQFELYQDAKNELDAVSVNAQLSGERASGDLSGKAIDKLQSAGTLELNRQYNLLVNWEKRIYRQIWSRIKSEWNEEKWIRVTDDQDNLRWVGLNSQVTVAQLLEETIEDESLQQEMRIGAAAQRKQMVEAQDQRLNQIVETRNDTSELDADIILEQSFDVVNIQQEQFQTLAQFGQGSDIDIIELIELSQIRGKDELIDKIEQRRAQAAQANGNIQQIQAQDAQAKMQLTAATAQEKQQSAIGKSIENQLMIANPDPNPQAVV